MNKGSLSEQNVKCKTQDNTLQQAIAQEVNIKLDNYWSYPETSLKVLFCNKSLLTQISFYQQKKTSRKNFCRTEFWV